MANFEDFFDEPENEYDDTGAYFKTGALRDATIFLVDCSERMFDSYDDNGTYFEKCLRAIQSTYQHKIYGSDKDLLSVVFYATEKHNTTDEFVHIYVLQQLDQPSAERIKELEALSRNFDYKKFRTEYGHSEQFSLENVLWCCQSMFSTVKQTLGTRRIMMFTKNDHPHINDKAKERLAKNRAKDLNDVGITVELIPVVNDNESFDYSKFYADMLMLSEEQVAQLPNPFEEFKELEKTMRTKDHKKRPYSHLKLKLSDDLSIGCSLFNLIRPCPKPSKVKLDKSTNVETKTVTRRYLPETGEILFASDMKMAIDITKEKRITFEQDEVKTIKRFNNPGINLLGFKPISSLKPYYYVKPGHFLYPDEKTIEGSTTAFNALLTKCLEKEKYILCEIIPRINTPPRLVALVPQEEELDDNKVQIAPPGFNVVYLPYADDFRQIDKNIDIESSSDHVDAFKKCIKKLKFRYDPESFDNPTIQKMWREIEAVALERVEAEQVEDLSKPDFEAIEAKAGKQLEEFSKLCFPDGMSTGKAKRKPAASSPNGTPSKRAKTESSEIDVLKEAQAGRLNKLTVPQLKEYAKSNGIKVSGTKKQDFIDAINAHIS